MLFIGLCFGIITFIQINNACAFLGFVAYLWIQYLLKKDYRKLFQSVGCFIAGWIIVAIPIVLYFYIIAGWHGVYEMVYAAFLSNLEYIEIQKFVSWYYWLPYTMFLISFLIINILILFKQKEVLIPLLISFLLFVGSFGKRCNAFYLIAMLPLCIASMMTFDVKTLRKAKLTLVIISTCSTVFLGSFVYFHIFNDLILQNEKEVTIYENFHNCIEIIPENERDSIFNYNLCWHGYSMMEHEKLLQCNRVSVAFDLPTLMKDEKTKPMFLPKWIMISSGLKIYDSDARVILNNYELVGQFNYDRLYLKKPRIGSYFTVYFYRIKD